QAHSHRCRVTRQLFDRRVGVDTKLFCVTGVSLLLMSTQFFYRSPAGNTFPVTQTRKHNQVANSKDESADKHIEPPARQRVIVLFNTIVRVTGSPVLFLILVANSNFTVG